MAFAPRYAAGRHHPQLPKRISRFSRDLTTYSREIAELVRQHQLGDSTEVSAAWRGAPRNRRRLMSDWSKFLEAPFKDGIAALERAAECLRRGRVPTWARSSSTLICTMPL
jgi:hypothetical protein